MDDATTNRIAKRYILDAWNLAEQGDYARAVRLVDRALKLRPTWSKPWVVKGHFLREAKRFDESEAVLRKALGIKCADHYAWTELGLLFRDRELFQKAAFCFRRSLEIRPDFNVYTLLANVELTFDPASAVANAEKALKLKPGWHEAIRIRDSGKRLMRDPRQ